MRTLTFGLAVAAMATLAGCTSGGLFNPGLSPVIDSDVARAFEPTPKKRLAALAIYARTLEATYDALLRKYRPRAVFVLNSYTEFVPAQRAVKRLGIPLIELQHGIIHHSHPGYAYPRGIQLPHAPDHIVTFGTRFGEILEETADYWKGRWSTGGHGWLKQRASEATPGERPRRVVFFSQSETDVQQQVAELAARVRTLLPSEFEVVVKPHPNERNTEAVYAQATNVGVRLAGVIDDSYRLLADCSVAVSLYSTVCLEALAFPCVSAVVRSPRWTEEIRAFVELGELVAVERAEDIVRLADTPQSRAGLTTARALFGIGAAPLDYESLIAKVASERV